ncbi:hypothetical protein PMAYCL1PPCAC_11840, partial [Pristionchus mayeri]
GDGVMSTVDVYEIVDDDYHSKDESVVGACELCTLVDHRCFYIHHGSRSTHWEPPWARWRCSLGLPYGWEQAIDARGRLYYLDHINERSSYRDPRSPNISSGLRRVVIERDENVGYGFVAAGSNAFVVQFVSPGGPSDGLLFPNDRIVSVNGENVEKDSKDSIVAKIRSSLRGITLHVEQMSSIVSSPRRGCRVRFTDKVSVSSPDTPIAGFPSSIPNVLRVFLENGQTRSFKYDATTTVKDVCTSLCEKLQLLSRRHFCLGLEYTIGNRSSRLTLLENEVTLQELASSRASSSTRCVFRFAFVPPDPYALYLEDPRSFEYFYSQCLNDVVCGRFAFEMRYEACIRMAALHMQQISMDSHLTKEGRVSLSRMERELGLGTFLPTILLENVKRSEIRKHIRFYLKKDRTAGHLTACTPRVCSQSGGTEEPSQSSVASSSVDGPILIRLKYIQILSHLPSFGCRSFSVTFRDSQVDMMMQVDPRSGIVVRNCGKTANGAAHPSISIAFHIISSICVQRASETISTFILRLNNDTHQGLHFLVENNELSELVIHIQGYFELHVGRPLPCDHLKEGTNEITDHPPPYASVHTVFPSGWNYSADGSPGEKIFDLRQRVPFYEVASNFAQSETSSPAFNSGLTRLEEEEEIHPLNGRVEEVVEKPRTLLKATDSLHCKNSRRLHSKENSSPLLQRHSGANGTLCSLATDSSDTEDSSISETFTQPVHSSLSFGLSSPDVLPSSLSIDSFLKHNTCEQTALDSILLLFPDKICTDREIIDLTSPIEESTPLPSRHTLNSEDHRRRVRFLSPLLTGRRIDSAPSTGPAPSRLGRSETFPISSLDEESVNMKAEDVREFLQRSNSVCDDEEISCASRLLSGGANNVRRMSLKEYSGLEPRSRDFSLSPWKQPSSPSSLLSSFSSRRRRCLSTECPSPLAPIPPSAASSNSPPPDIVSITARLEMLRLRLSEEREKEAEVIKDEDKHRLLEATRALSAVSKRVVRECSLSNGLDESLIASAETVVNVAEKCLARITTVFHAQLLIAKVDQVLASLIHSLPYFTAPSHSSIDSLRSSTSLAASLSQLIQTVASL